MIFKEEKLVLKDSMTIRQEETLAKGLSDSPNTMAITCHIGSHIAGICEIKFLTAMKTARRSEAAIGLIIKY